LTDVANDPGVDAVWFARGGYGAVRTVDRVLPHLTEIARSKRYLGYSDGGYLLAALDQAGFPHVAHGPVLADLRRDGGEAAFVRALRWLADAAADTVEPQVGPAGALAFNLTILSHLIGTPLEPDFAGRTLLVEDVSEHVYRTDRAFAHLASAPGFRACAGLRLGRFSDVPENDPAFLETEEEIARHWCGVAGVPYLGRADIGHDAGNKIVPFRAWGS
jgi:muramoyltetrapeptide carboxypeptidase